MAKQYHFVVVVNEDGSFGFDFDVSINFDNGEVYDTETGQWYPAIDEDLESYDEAFDLLRNRLEGK